MGHAWWCEIVLRGYVVGDPLSCIDVAYGERDFGAGTRKRGCDRYTDAGRCPSHDCMFTRQVMLCQKMGCGRLRV